QRNRIDRTARIVNQSSANRGLFHLQSKEEIRSEFSRRNEGADRNTWLYSYNPLTVELTESIHAAKASAHFRSASEPTGCMSASSWRCHRFATIDSEPAPTMLSPASRAA